MINKARVQAGLSALDALGAEIWAKLDAGTEAFYQQVNRTMVPFSRVLANLAATARSYRTVIQSLFFVADGAPPPEGEIEAYIERLEEITAEGALEEVHIYTIARPPAEAWCTPLSVAQVDAIVAQVQAAIEAPVRGFYGPPET